MKAAPIPSIASLNGASTPRPIPVPALTPPLPSIPACPLPISDYREIVLAHGSGGKLSRELIDRIVQPAFANPLLDPLHDGAVFSIGDTRVAFTTDSFVVNPLFFPGGDIGTLAVNGTINDLAMCGAQPLHLSAAFILEEGLPMDEFQRIVQSMQAAATAAGVTIVTGDTKVVDRGKGDRIFINTSGLGLVAPGANINPRRATIGDRVIVSGQIATHGIAIMSVREGLEFETEITSDTAPLHHLVETILAASHDVHVLRDPTRGGLSSTLVEIATTARVGIHLEEANLPIAEDVNAACELLGLDPLYVANEGKLVAIVPATDAKAVLTAMRAHPLGAQAAIIGEVIADHPGRVIMRTRVGGDRIVDLLPGEQLPRIC